MPNRNILELIKENLNDHLGKLAINEWSNFLKSITLCINLKIYNKTIIITRIQRIN